MGEVYRYRRLKHAPPKRLGTGLPETRSDRGRRHRDWFSTIGIMACAFVATAFMTSLLLEDGQLAAPTLPGDEAGSAAVGWRSYSTGDLERAHFTLCIQGRGSNCVIDGDTLRYQGDIIRIADIDTPEVRNYGCAAEKMRGDAATARLLALINAGPFTLAPYDRDRDRYGRALRIITRDGRSLGMTLVAEGLAREWDGARRGWC